MTAPRRRQDSLSYSVSDGTDTVTAMVTITVNPVNDPPVAVGDTAAVDEGGTLSLEASALLDNDTDAEDDPLSIVAVGGAVNGTVFLDGTTIIYEHDGSETTTDSLSYSVSDGTDAVTAMVTITVAPVNDPPVAVGDTAAVDEGGTLSLEESALLDNDTDAEDDPLSIVAVGDAVNGTVFLDGTTIIYAHDGSETTTGSLSYVRQRRDGHRHSDGDDHGESGQRCPCSALHCAGTWRCARGCCGASGDENKEVRATYIRTAASNRVD